MNNRYYWKIFIMFICFMKDFISLFIETGGPVASWSRSIWFGIEREIADRVWLNFNARVDMLGSDERGKKKKNCNSILAHNTPDSLSHKFHISNGRNNLILNHLTQLMF
ncbi:hypothetical protein ACJX0J_030240 [Zea mays]